MTMPAKILLVDDDPDHLGIVECYTSSLGIPYRAVPSALDAVRYLREESYDLLLSDLVMPDMDGMELLRHAREHHPGVDVIVMTGFSKAYSYMDVIKAGAADFIAKPFQRDEFQAKVNRLFRERALLRELRLAKERAEVASKAKSDFINTISHEFRTPMNGIIGFTSILCGLELPGKPGEYARIISASAARLMKLISQLLDFSRLEAGEMDLEPRVFALPAFLDAIAPGLEQMAARKRLPLHITMDPDLPATKLYGDTTILSQILHHLVDNAVKFSERGAIGIEVACEEIPTPASIRLRFSVSDNGCGVSPEQMERIFAPFTQAEEYMTRRHEGAGIGLAICTKVARLLHGRIWGESCIGQGSTFSFTATLGLA